MLKVARLSVKCQPAKVGACATETLVVDVQLLAAGMCMIDCCHVPYLPPQETCKPALGATVVVKVRSQHGPASGDCTD